MFIIAMVIPLLSGCLDNGSTYAPPENFAVTPGDGRVTVTWTPNYSVDYWVFAATDPSLTAFNWVSLPNAHAYNLVPTPLYLCGLLIGDQYYFAANGRTSGGPGGPSSPTVSAAPYDASTRWAAGTTGSTTDLYGVGYTSLWTCFNNPTTSGSGTFAAVGKGGAIYTSADGKSWVNQPAPAGFTSDLYAVTGFTAFPNYPVNIPPYLPIAPQFWVAVGKAGASLFSIDGINWQLGGSVSNSLGGATTNQNLNAITQVNGVFVAVGDQGTIMFTNWAVNGGLYWQMAATPSSIPNLHGVAHGSVFAAVGDNGTILISGDGGIWAAPQAVQLGSPVTTSNLRQVAVSLTGIIVAVGDNGTIVNSTNNGANWNEQTLPGAPNLISVTVENNQVFANALADPLLGNIVPSTEFVAMDSSGNVYHSVNGVNWSGPMASGITSPNAMVSSGFGYVAAGPGGTTAYAF